MSIEHQQSIYSISWKDQRQSGINRMKQFMWSSVQYLSPPDEFL